jgi:4-hydroxybenzoate polyprenyltransferase
MWYEISPNDLNTDIPVQLWAPSMILGIELLGELSENQACHGKLIPGHPAAVACSCFAGRIVMLILNTKWDIERDKNDSSEKVTNGQDRKIVGGSLILSLLATSAAILTLLLMEIWIMSLGGTTSTGGYL